MAIVLIIAKFNRSSGCATIRLLRLPPDNHKSYSTEGKGHGRKAVREVYLLLTAYREGRQRTLRVNCALVVINPELNGGCGAKHELH